MKLPVTLINESGPTNLALRWTHQGTLPFVDASGHGMFDVLSGHHRLLYLATLMHCVPIGDDEHSFGHAKYYCGIRKDLVGRVSRGLQDHGRVREIMKSKVQES